jgi:hypothetical protein
MIVVGNNGSFSASFCFFFRVAKGLSLRALASVIFFTLSFTADYDLTMKISDCQWSFDFQLYARPCISAVSFSGVLFRLPLTNR